MPIAAAVATELPHIDENKAVANTLMTGRPPRVCRRSVSIKLMSLIVAPLRLMISAARMKNGMASRPEEFNEENN